jgi:hypothetical protein
MYVSNGNLLFQFEILICLPYRNLLAGADIGKILSPKAEVIPGPGSLSDHITQGLYCVA